MSVKIGRYARLTQVISDTIFDLKQGLLRKHTCGEETGMTALDVAAMEPLSASVSQAAELMGLKDVKTVYGLIHRGIIRARKCGRIYLVNYRNLKNYVGANAD